MLCVVPISATAAAAATAADPIQEPTSLLWSWPDQGTSLWVPAREGRLVFSAPVRSSSVTAALETATGTPVEELTRTTRGESVEVVLFRFPEIPEGRYLLKWAAVSVDDEALAGTVSFSVPERFTAPGGGNHRHSAAHVYKDSLGQLTLRLMLVVSAALSIMVAAASQPRRLWQAVVSRVAAMLAAAAALIWVMADVIQQVVDNDDSPVLAVLASPRPWVLLPLAAAGVLQLIVGRSGRHAGWLAGITVVAAAASSHPGGGAVHWLQIPAMSALVLASAFAFSLLGQAAAPRPPGRLVSRAFTLAAAVSSASLLLLLTHTRSLEMRGLFFDDARTRVAASVAVLLCLPFSAHLLTKGGVLKAAGVVVALVAAVALAALLRIPPPVVGL